MALVRARRGGGPPTGHRILVGHPHPNPPPQARERGRTVGVAFFPLPLAGEGAEQREAGGGSLRESQCGESPHPGPPPQARERGRTAPRSSFMSCLGGVRRDDVPLGQWPTWQTKPERNRSFTND